MDGPMDVNKKAPEQLQFVLILDKVSQPSIKLL